MSLRSNNTHRLQGPTFRFLNKRGRHAHNKHNMRIWMAAALSCMIGAGVWAQQETPQRVNTNAFRQLGQELPTPNVYRTASGAPGHAYWQQKADYNMKIRLDDATQRIDGSETITYTNNSLDALQYVWLQLDQNVRALDSDSYKIRESSLDDRTYFSDLEQIGTHV